MVNLGNAKVMPDDVELMHMPSKAMMAAALAGLNFVFAVRCISERRPEPSLLCVCC